MQYYEYLLIFELLNYSEYAILTMKFNISPHAFLSICMTSLQSMKVIGLFEYFTWRGPFFVSIDAQLAIYL